MGRRLWTIEIHHFELGYERLHGRRWMGRLMGQRIAESSTNPPIILRAQNGEPAFSRVCLSGWWIWPFIKRGCPDVQKYTDC